MTKETLILGLGKTGFSCARYMHRHGMAAKVFDSRENPPELPRLQAELPHMPYQLGPFHAADFIQAKELIVSPGVDVKQTAIQAAKAQGIPVLGDIELFAQEVNAAVLAVTGSNGKSTVVTLLAAMAKQARRVVKVGGNLGTPALDLLQDQGVDLYILELSSFQLETTQTLKPLAATVLNVSPDHLDRYDDDLEAYSQAKQSIYTHAQHCIVNREDSRVMAMVPLDHHGFSFGLDAPTHSRAFGLAGEAGGEWLCQGVSRLLPTTKLRLVGRHNLANALAALSLGCAVGLPMAAMLQALQEYPGLAHRAQWIAEKEGISWYNDSKATNVGASIASLRGMPGKVVLIAGGDGKGADFGPLKEAVQAKARAVILLGRDGPLIERAIAAAVPIYKVSSMAQAVSQARHQAQSGDSVLLSPACASWDMYNGFAERGADYVQCVREVLK